MELQDRIATARKNAGLSQEQLGEHLGVSRQAVSKWESGQSNPDLQYIISMARLFGVSTDWLLVGEEPPQDALQMRCPECGVIITPMDDFCAKCGRPLREQTARKYSLLLTKMESPTAFENNLRSLLKKYGIKPAFSMAASPMSNDIDYTQALQRTPLFLCSGLDAKTAKAFYDRLCYHGNISIYLDRGAVSPQELHELDLVPHIELNREINATREPLSFLAVVAAVVVAILILSFL